MRLFYDPCASRDFCNYVEAKKIIEKAPIEIFCGKAINVKIIKEKLEAAGIDFKIEPDFPY